MKAAVIHEFGSPTVLQYEDIATPDIKDNEVLIQVNAAGVNHVDLDIRAGISGMPVSLPHIPGVDAVGTIVKRGSGVHGFSEGDRVAPHYELACGQCRNCLAGKENICLQFDILGGTRWGTYAEYVIVSEHHLMRVPKSLSAEDAVSSFVPFATAWEAMMKVGKLQAGETVLVNAAGSGVGSAGLQVANLAGCRIITTSGSDDKLERAKDFGADVTINYREQGVVDAVMDATSGKGVDLALDMVGGEILQATIKSMTAGGRIVSVGAHAGEKVEIDFIDLFRNHITIHGCGRSTRAVGELVFELVAEGKLKPVIDRVLPLEKAAEAHQLLQDRACFGRIVLAVSP